MGSGSKSPKCYLTVCEVLYEEPATLKVDLYAWFGAQRFQRGINGWIADRIFVGFWNGLIGENRSCGYHRGDPADQMLKGALYQGSNVRVERSGRSPDSAPQAQTLSARLRRAGSTPILRTLSLRLILSRRSVHVEAQALQP